MKITLFGATGNLGEECLRQSLDAGHEVTVLVRTPSKLPQGIVSNVSIVEGDALKRDDLERALPPETEAVLFAIAVDEKTSPRDLCTDVTREIFRIMRKNKIDRFVWCGGGSSLVEEDVITFGAKFVHWYSRTFLNHRHSDKEHQLEVLNDNRDISWIGIRPLQMKHGATTGQYRLGFHPFSGMSKITFGDCAHAMVGMLIDDKWLRKAPIIQY